MQHRYMLDTNIVSYYIKGHPVVLRRVQAVLMSSLCMSVITQAELLYGLAKNPQAVKLHELVSELFHCIEVLPWESSAAFCYGKLRAELEQKGQPASQLDLLIAAHAFQSDSILVTNDLVLSRIEGLRTQNWAL